MSEIPTRQPVSRDNPLWPLCSAMCDGTITEEQLARLEVLLRTSATNRLLYASYMRMNGQLMLTFMQRRIPGEESEGGGRPTDDLAHDSESPQHLNPAPAPPAPTTPESPVLGFLGEATQYMSQFGPFSNWLLALIICCGAVVAWHVANQKPRDHQSTFVARVAGVVNGQWKDPSQAVSTGTRVALGSQFALASGLVEIAYDSGAKVVLQGPAMFTIESENGGFLSTGKLTGKIVSETARGLAIRTPTATVVDLGTEFGVAVQPSGVTSTHVFRGVVEVRHAAADSSQSRSFRLAKNESMSLEDRVASDGRRRLAVSWDTADPTAFVSFRQFEEKLVLQRSRVARWQAHSRRLRNDPDLVAYYTFEPRPDNSNVLPNLSSVGSRLDAEIKGAQWVDGRLPGKHALRFHGVDVNDRVILPEPDRFNFPGAFTVAIWFRVERFTEPWQTLISKGGFESWRLHRHRNTGGLDFSTTDGVRAIGQEANVADGRWHLAVAVYEPVEDGAVKSLYIDGRLEAAKPLSSIRKSDKAVQLGGNDSAGASRNLRNFEGEIDEVAFFSRALSAEEVAAMAAAGDPSGDMVVQRSTENH
ncbi:MAG: LamG-like jellyroll fold domain-containing protein [Thermoguttaceae bacterium]